MLQGLPNTFGGYDETPEVTAQHLKVWSISHECVLSDVLETRIICLYFMHIYNNIVVGLSVCVCVFFVCFFFRWLCMSFDNL